MSVEQMRSFVSNAYTGRNWPDKVRKMSDEQVVAIYNRLLNKQRKTEK